MSEEEKSKIYDSMDYQFRNLGVRNKTLYEFLDTIHKEGKALAQILMDIVENDGILLDKLHEAYLQLKKTREGEEG